MNSLLVLNIGSSSIKFAVFEGRKKTLFGFIDRIGSQAWLTLGHAPARPAKVRTLSEGLNHIHQFLESKRVRPSIVAHRVVHGGGIYRQPTQVTPAVFKRLESFIDLAPLHLPHNLIGIRLAQRYWPTSTAWAVFDTAAFDRLPEHIQLYALPLAVSRRWHIRKYGFHGISHRWALEQAAKKLSQPLSRVNAVTIHLGAGDSMALWRHGRPLDTTMGFTPLQGLLMSTRSGDLDPAIPLFLVQHGYAVSTVQDMLEHRSGLFGLTGLHDMRDILAAAGHPIPRWPRRRWTATQRRYARLAVAMFVADIQRYLASYLGQLDRVDAIVLTGSIAHSAWLVSRILTLPAARHIRHIKIPTDEETAIATDVRRMVH